MTDTFIMRGEWIKNISTLPLEMQDKVLAEIVRYGTRQPTQYDDDPVIFSIVNGYKGSIDNTISDYERKKEMSKTAGRKKKVNDMDVYELARENPKYTSQDIADILGVSKSSIDHSDGWKNRYKDSVDFQSV